MNLRNIVSKTVYGLRLGLASIALFQFTIGAGFAGDTKPEANFHHDNQTTSPIKHVIVIIGENRSFDHVFATYVPRSGQHVSNLLSRGIINADGTPGRNHEASAQHAATDTRRYAISPARTFAYVNIPPPGTHEAPSVASDDKPAPFASIAAARAAEHDLANDYYPYLLTGATGLPPDVIDTRIANYENLGPGTFQLTPSVKYDDYAASPVHRFYQMWQQADCSVEHATAANPSGCRNDLYAWVEVTAGAGSPIFVARPTDRDARPADKRPRRRSRCGALSQPSRSEIPLSPTTRTATWRSSGI